MISCLRDEEAEIQVAAERGFLEGVNGSCHIPIGAYCKVDGEKIKLTGLFGDKDGKKIITKNIDGSSNNPRKLGIELAKLVLKEYESYER